MQFYFLQPRNLLSGRLGDFLSSFNLGKAYIHLGKRRFCKTVGFFLFVLGLLVFFPGLSEWIELDIIDFVTAIEAKSNSPDPRIVVVGIDTHTLEKGPSRWPWPRSELAKLLRAIGNGTPRGIVLDIVLQHPEPADGGKGDRILQDTFESLGNVSMISLLEESITKAGPEFRHFHNAEGFRQKALFEGFARVLVDQDKVFRAFPLYETRLGIDSCALKVAREIASGTIPANEFLPTESLISFAEQGGGIPQFSAEHLLTGKTSPEFLKDKLVILGVTAPAVHDFHPTSRGILPGAVILAATIDTLLRQKIVKRNRALLFRFVVVILGFFTAMAPLRFPRLESFIWSLFSGLLTAVVILWAGIQLGVYPPAGTFLLAWAWTSLSRVTLNRFTHFMDFHEAKLEAKAAGKIQSQIYPDKAIFLPGGYSCRGLVIPYEEVGGDYLDYLTFPDGSLFFFLGDVTGHGISAALITHMAKTATILLNREKKLTPVNLVLALDAILRDHFEKKRLMTAFVGHLVPETNKLSFVNCGHPTTFLFRQNGTTEKIGKKGLPLGVSKKFKPSSQEILLDPGDTLVAYTDGIPEAINWKNLAYTYDKWQAHLAAVIPSFSPEAPLEDLLVDAKKHSEGRPFEDDISILIINRSQSNQQNFT